MHQDFADKLKLALDQASCWQVDGNFLDICLSIYLSIYLSVYLSIYLSIYSTFRSQSIYLSNIKIDKKILCRYRQEIESSEVEEQGQEMESSEDEDQAHFCCVVGRSCVL